MLIQLVTPLMLATSPMTISNEPVQYSHLTQQVIYKNDQVAGSPFTAGTTQTFNGNGQPRDSDGD